MATDRKVVAVHHWLQRTQNGKNEKPTHFLELRVLLCLSFALGFSFFSVHV
jgi:hypothetical protein